MVFYLFSSIIIQAFGDRGYRELAKDIQRRLIISSSWSFGVSTLFILGILGMQTIAGIFTSNHIFLSVRVGIASVCLLILLPLFICHLTMNMWTILKVKDRVYERRCDPILELFSKFRVLFMVKCGLIGLFLAIFLRELLCSNVYISYFETRIVSDGSQEATLNEKAVFLLVWAGFSGAVFSGKMFVCNADTLVFRPSEGTKLHEVAAMTFYNVIPRAVKVTIRQMVYFLPIYYVVFRQLKLLTILSIITGSLEMSHNYLLNIVLDIQLLLYSILIGLCIHVILATLLMSLRIHNSQALPFPLVRGVFDLETEVLQTYLQADKTSPLQYMALRRLVDISQSPSPSDRKPVFQLSELGGHAHTWNVISVTCRNILTNFLAEIKSANANLLHKGHIPRTIAMQRTVLPDHLLARLHVGDSSPLGKSGNGTPARPVINDKRWLWNLAQERILQSRLVQFVLAPLPFAATMRVFSGSQAVLWAAETLSSLAVASVVEDEFGVVQRDLVDIVELLTGVHEGVEKHLKLSGLYSLGATSPPVSVALLYSEPDMPWRFRATLNRAVLRVAEVFATHLDALEIRKEAKAVLETMTRSRR